MSVLINKNDILISLAPSVLHGINDPESTLGMDGDLYFITLEFPITEIVTASKLISDDDPIIIYDESSTWDGAPIEWQVIGINQDGNNTVTLQTNKVLTGFAWDSKNTNSDEYRNAQGANRIDSLLHQWLNSDQVNWYASQHSNQAPSASTVANYNNYGMDTSTVTGFMTNLSSSFKNNLITITKYVTPYQSGDPDSFTGKLFCPSLREVDPTMTDNYIAESGAFTYQRFQNNSKERRVRDAASSATGRYWLRSPSTVKSNLTLRVHIDGTVAGNNSQNTIVGASPICVLPINSIILKKTMNNKYKIIWK